MSLQVHATLRLRASIRSSARSAERQKTAPPPSGSRIARTEPRYPLGGVPRNDHPACTANASFSDSLACNSLVEVCYGQPARDAASRFMILAKLLDETLARNPMATTPLAPFRATLSGDASPQRIAAPASAVRDAKVGKQDKVAVVLPNGPKMAFALFATASGAVCVSVGSAHKPHRSDDEIVDAIGCATPARSFEPRPQCAPPTRTTR